MGLKFSLPFLVAGLILVLSKVSGFLSLSYQYGQAQIFNFRSALDTLACVGFSQTNVLKIFQKMLGILYLDFSVIVLYLASVYG